MSERTHIDYWTMPDRQLAAAHDEILARGNRDQWRDDTGEIVETLAFIEDAILQRIGAPEDADPDAPAWYARIVAFATEQAR